jgi:hypothetical protein
MGEPFLTQDPNFGGPGKPGFCYCCCSCFAADTPIEAAHDRFVMVQDIQAGDTILAAGKDLEWKPAKVKDRSGGYDKSVIAGLFLVVFKFAEEEGVRQILVTPGHLFMMASQRTLKTVNTIIPGDALLRNDGGKAKVLFVAPGEHNTTIHTLLMDAPFDGKTLDGHLINANGIVTTDFVVQMHFEANSGDTSLLYSFSKNEDVLEAGTPEYADRFTSPELHEFLQDEDTWPAGFRPYHEGDLVNIPASASPFFTEAQAGDIQKNAKFNAISNTVPRTEALRLFRSYRALYPDTVFLIDWHNPLPNAYSWTLTGQNVILITGGMVRVSTLYMGGLSLIFSTLQSRIDDDKYVCWSDYNASAYIMRNAWSDTLYPDVIMKGLDQVGTLFGYVSKKNAKGNPLKPGEDPSLDCRMQSFTRGLSFLGVPDCGKPLAESFRLVRASANVDLNEVTLTFSTALEQDSVENVTNYMFLPEVIVSSVNLETDNDNRVTLSVDGVKSEVNYMITVSNVLSAEGVPLSPDHGTVVLKT